MGLGGLVSVSYPMHALRPFNNRAVVADRVDPIIARNADRAQQVLAAAKSVTFAQCAERYVETHKAGWRNAKHAWQWEQTLRACCGPVFGDLPVQDVDTPLVLQVLEPMWTTKTETASRLRGRIEKVLDWAKVRGYRTVDNPAAWRGHLDQLLPALSKRKRVQQHPALPFALIGEFMSDLRAP